MANRCAAAKKAARTRKLRAAGSKAVRTLSEGVERAEWQSQKPDRFIRLLLISPKYNTEMPTIGVALAWNRVLILKEPHQR